MSAKQRHLQRDIESVGHEINAAESFLATVKIWAALAPSFSSYRELAEREIARAEAWVAELDETKIDLINRLANAQRFESGVVA